eukprot:m51a1_g9454 hypothetical protein (336) ;mRNA; f:504602-506057
MPIKPLLSWEQDDEYVVVKLAMAGVTRPSLSLEATPTHVRVACRPYLVVLDLWAPVDDLASAAEIHPGSLVLRLRKSAPRLAWPALEVAGLDAGQLRARRAGADEAVRRRRDEQAHAQREAKFEAEHDATRRRVEAESRERESAERAKDQAIAGVVSGASRRDGEGMEDEEAPPREPQRVVFELSSRPRDTMPLREGGGEQPGAAAASERKRAASELKARGDACFHAGEFADAVDFYSAAIDIAPDSPELFSWFSNRAAAELASGSLEKCVEDSAKALELMSAKGVGAGQSRARALARRGAALGSLGRIQEALADYEEARTSTAAADVLTGLQPA